MKHAAPCPKCQTVCTWARSDSEYAPGTTVETISTPVRTVYSHRCKCGAKFTHTETPD